MNDARLGWHRCQTERLVTDEFMDKFPAGDSVAELNPESSD
jgi:hypothetical protein